MFGTQTLCVQSISVSGGDYTTGGACTVETTTTTTTAAPTTTTAAPACNEWNLYTNGNSGDFGCFDYIDCTSTPQNVCVDNSASVTICAIGTPSQSSGTGVNASNQGPCATTTTTTTTVAPSATLQWDFSETGGADGTMYLYVNGSVVETRTSTSNGLYTVYEGDTINVEVTCDTCGSPNVCSTAESQSNKSILVASDTQNNSIASIFTSVYTVVSGDIGGNNINISTFAICNSTCL